MGKTITIRMKDMTVGKGAAKSRTVKSTASKSVVLDKTSTAILSVMRDTGLDYTQARAFVEGETARLTAEHAAKEATYIDMTPAMAAKVKEIAEAVKVNVKSAPKCGASPYAWKNAVKSGKCTPECAAYLDSIGVK